MMGLDNVDCNVCRQAGGLTRKKVYRFSTPIVVIGWLFLIPSLLGVSCGACGLISTGSVTTEQVAQSADRYKGALRQIDGLSKNQVERIYEMESPSEESLKAMGLNPAQAREASVAHTSLVAGGAGTALGAGMMGGASVFVIVASFISGLLGYILILRKKVIACNRCNGIHSDAV